MTVSAWRVGQVRMDLPAAGALYLPGIGTNFVSTPDSSANSIPGDLDIRAVVAPVDWTPAYPGQAFLAKVTPFGIISWQFTLLDTGHLEFAYSTNGSAIDIADSTAATGFTDGTKHGVRVTRRRSDGRIQFFTSPDGVTWSQLGSDVFTDPAEDIYDSDAAVTIGARSDSGLPFEGLVFYAELRDGINGTVVHSFDATTVTKLGTRNPSTVTAGGPWTVNGGAWDWVAP